MLVVFLWILREYSCHYKSRTFLTVSRRFLNDECIGKQQLNEEVHFSPRCVLLQCNLNIQVQKSEDLFTVKMYITLVFRMDVSQIVLIRRMQVIVTSMYAGRCSQCQYSELTFVSFVPTCPLLGHTCFMTESLLECILKKISEIKKNLQLGTSRMSHILSINSNKVQ